MKPNDKTISQTPFQSDTEYLDAEFSWLKHHTRLLDTERQLDDAIMYAPNSNGKQVGKTERVSAKELTRRLEELRTDVKDFRGQIDSRIDAHRKEGAFPLGLDILCKSADLSDEERFILVALALPAINTTLTNEAFSNLGLFGPDLQINELISLLRPKGSEDWIRYRQMFHIDAPLVKDQLVTVEYPGREANPGDILYATARITMRTLAMMTGHLELACEGGCPTGNETH